MEIIEKEEEMSVVFF